MRERDALSSLAAAGTEDTAFASGPGSGSGLVVAAFEASADAVVISDVDTVIRAWNPAAETLYGIPAGEAVGRRFRDLVETTIPGREFEPGELCRLVERYGLWRGRLIDRPRVGGRAGTAIVIETTASPIRDATGGLRGIVETIRDVTATADLEAHLAALRPLAEATGHARTADEVASIGLDIMCGAVGAPRGVIVTTVDDGFRVAAERNLPPGLAALVESYPPAESRVLDALAQPNTILTGPLDSFPISEPIVAILRAADVRWLTVTGLHVRGAQTGLVMLAWGGDTMPQPPEALLLQAASQVAAVLANARLLDRLEASEGRYRALYEQSPVPIMLVSPDLTITDANAAAGALLAATPESLIGRRASQLDRQTDAERARELEVLLRDGHITVTTTGTRLGGTTFPVQAECSLVRLEKGPRILVHLRDLTEQKRLEQELVQAQKMEAVGQLVSGVAHELNNPLAAIVGFSQLIRRDPSLPADLRHNADLLVGEADRTRRIVQNLLDFARQRPPERHLTPLGPLVRSVLDLAAYGLAAARIEPVAEIPADLPLVPLDRAQMQQVLLNLVTNSVQAIRSTGRPGTIRFTAGPITLRDHQGIRLTIADDGPGIPKRERDRLFVPFFTTKPPGEGTGLGLSVSFGIVQGHGGGLSFQPGPGGHGAIFHIDLPLARPAPDHAARQDDGIAGPPRGPVATGGPSEEGATSDAAESPAVLVLDDEPAIRELLRKFLRAAGFTPVVTVDGAEAVAAVRERSFATVLCDYKMAGMSGTDVYEAVVAIRPELARRFVFMSGDVLNPELHAFATRRGIELLAKPFDLDTVDRVVREAAEGDV